MNVLDQICADKKKHVEVMKVQTGLDALEIKIKESSPTAGFKKTISDSSAAGNIALITEIKKASPSGGLIREKFDPVAIGRAYEEAGAACLSILTDEPYFQGKDEYIARVKQAVSLPVLRKDFMIDPYQIYESRALGADCVLLILAALDDSQAQELYDAARGLDLDVLVEVHDSKELERALAFTEAMIGVNNRNLKTLDVNLGTSLELVKKIPGSFVKIAESGIHTHRDLTELQGAGYDGFLVGESLMRQDDVVAAVRNLLGTLDTERELK